MQILKSKFENYFKKIIIFGSGIALKNILNWPFDFVLYPIVLIWLGNVIGGIVMIILSMLYNIILIRAYDWSKTDWLLIETLKGLRENVVAGKWSGIIAKILQKSKILAFFLLCLDDPITVTLYMREGSYRYNGLSQWDWKIFFLATIVSNIYWIIGWATIIQLTKEIMLILL